MDSIREVWVRAQAGVVGLGAALNLGEHAGDAVFLAHVSESLQRMARDNSTHTAVWERIDSCEILGDRDTGEKRGGYHEGLHLEGRL